MVRISSREMAGPTGQPQVLSRQAAGSWPSSSLSLSASSATRSTSGRSRVVRSSLLRTVLPLSLLLLLLAGLVATASVEIDASGAPAADDEDELEDIDDDDENENTVLHQPQTEGGRGGRGGGGGEEGPAMDWIESNGIRYATLKEGDCRKKAEFGDTVHITHIGAKPGFDEEGNQRMEQFDGSGDKPLKVDLGAARIIKGMERGMVGQCLGEQRNILIPPELAFDDRSLNFKQKPVPDGTTILYQITMVKIAKAGGSPGISAIFEDFWGTLSTYYQVVLFFGAVAYAIYKCGPKRRAQKKKNKRG